MHIKIENILPYNYSLKGVVHKLCHTVRREGISQICFKMCQGEPGDL